jgi:two-component system, cell cycle sensor histidine kinase and response regulator CckA
MGRRRLLYRMLFKTHPSPMWVHDRTSLQFLAVNDAAVREYGYSRKEFLDMRTTDVVAARDVEAAQGPGPGNGPQLDSERRAGEISARPTAERHRCKDNSIIDVQTQSHRLVWKQRPAQLVLVKKCTDPRHLNEQLRQAQRMEAIGRLAGGVAHDFNNLLTIINGYSEIMLSGLSAGDPLRENAEQIRQAGEKAATLTHQLLAFSRKQVLDPIVLNLNDLVVGMEKMLRRLIGEDIDLRVCPHPGLWLVKADPGQIEQVVMNLAVNARDAMPQGGKLTIETANVELDAAYREGHQYAQPGQYALLAVSDTGCGMDLATRSRLFEPFFTTKEPERGTGLGLATVYGTIKQSNGYIEVYSELALGTTFKIYLPRTRETTSSGKANLLITRPIRGTETILLVEDEDAVRGLARSVLQAQGYTVFEARNGSEALLIAQQHSDPIDLTVSDVVMPNLSGRCLAGRLRALRPGMKFLFLSGYTNETVIRHGVLDCQIPFLQKPFSALALARKVREVLDE